MDLTTILWKISFTSHLISNSVFLGSSFIFAYSNKNNVLKEEIIKRYTKILSLFVFISGISGIILLSILSMNGMDDLTKSSTGQTILAMILGYTITLFVFVLTLIYKGGDENVYKKMFSIMFHVYLLIYLLIGFLI